MCDISYDIERTKDVFTLDYEEGYIQYDRIYNSSNDSYRSIISNFDIKDKKVLSVLGSGDQAFHLYKSGAKIVDVFDINKLTIYYYFLRIWIIKYLGRAYPPYDFDNQYIINLLGHVSPTSQLEQNAYNYWSMYVKTYDSECNYKLFNHFLISNSVFAISLIISKLMLFLVIIGLLDCKFLLYICSFFINLFSSSFTTFDSI